MLCPIMLHTKFELNRSIIERKKFEAMSEDTSADVLGNINIGNLTPVGRNGFYFQKLLELE